MEGYDDVNIYRIKRFKNKDVYFLLSVCNYF